MSEYEIARRMALTYGIILTAGPLLGLIVFTVGVVFFS